MNSDSSLLSSSFETQAPAGSARAAWQGRWRLLAPRERRLVAGAAWAIGLALLWALGIRPAWRTLQTAPARIAQLEWQTHQMRTQAAEVQALRQAAAVPAADAAQALQAATAVLGDTARLSLRGDRAVLTLNGVSPSAWQAWLAQARSAARARAVEAQLGSGPAGFSGTVTVMLPNSP